MSWRQQPPVLSPVSGRALRSGFLTALGARRGPAESIESALCERYRAVEALLTDSGTSALILALRAILPVGGTVAFPGYACIDLTTAALGAGARVRLYDVDPITLSPDLESVRRAIKRGVDAIVVAHLYGYASDVNGIKALAAEHGIPVIEDSAQGAGGTLNGSPLGSLGDVAILSFGRGKGITCGSGGALLVNSPAIADRMGRVKSGLPVPSRGGFELVSLVALRLLSNPSLYRLPASTPGLKLGEMVYHPPRPPRAMSATSMAVLKCALEGEDGVVADRRAKAGKILARLRGIHGVAPVRSIAGGEPGFLRLAMLDSASRAVPQPRLGFLRSYPATLEQHPQLAPLLHSGERAGKGSEYLRDRLFTIPTHQHFKPSDFEVLADWLGDRRLDSRDVVAVT